MSNETTHINEAALVAAEQETKLAVSTEQEAPLGFEEDDSDDLIIPRVKIIQTLSPERKEKIADEGDILNSLTKDKLNGNVFVPVLKFNSNILWKDRTDGGGILCKANDAKMGQASDGTVLNCKICKKCEFDNSKQGKEALPLCTKYINFLGFFEGDYAPIILSFAKTNQAEGKKLYSLAKVTMQNIWNHGYMLVSKEVTKGNNSWFNIDIKPNGPTDNNDRVFARQLFDMWNGKLNDMKFAVDEEQSRGNTVENVDITGSEEY